MRYLTLCAIAALLCALTSVAMGLSLEEPSVPEPALVSKCKEDLAKRLNVDVKEVTLVGAEPVVWPDASLGMPETGKLYAQALTPGYRVTLEARKSQYLYVTSDKAFRYGGPVSLWSGSILFIKPVESEPNLNGDLYQCSPLGTNATRLIEGVSDFYPQQGGIVIVKRRTSRSGHDLLYMKANEPAKATILRSAMDFGDIALNTSATEWAGFVKPGVGAAWTVMVAPLDKKDAEPISLPLPAGVQPSRIAWNDQTLIALVKKGYETLCYETSPKAENPEWKQVGIHTFPGLPPYMLNKSQTLVIEQVEDGGRPAVEVAKVWFTGDRDVVAKIPGLTMRGSEPLADRFFLIWGESDGKPATYTVDVHTGEVTAAASGLPRDIKPFAYASISSPLTAKSTAIQK